MVGLVGAECLKCGRVTFPLRESCQVCGARETRAKKLSGRGVIESVTRIGERSIGEIRLDDGPLVMGWMMEEGLVGAGVEAMDESEPLRFEVRHDA